MGDLVKWRGGSSSLETKIERWRRARHETLPARPGANGFEGPSRDKNPGGDVIPALTTETRLDLPRCCAVTRKLWAARYLRDDAAQGLRYIRSVIPDGRIRLTLYRPEDVRVLPDFEAGLEDCPHCGAYTPDGCLGSVWCGACSSWVCFGLTSREGLFICGCGHRGPLVNYRQTALGVVLR